MKFEIAGGYAAMRNSSGVDTFLGRVDTTGGNGWFASWQRNYNQWLGLTVEGTGASATEHQHVDARIARTLGPPDFAGYTFDTPTSGSAALVGPTFSYRRAPHIVLFGRLIGGLATGAFAIEPGGGIDVIIAPRLAVRVAADRRSLIGVGTGGGAAASNVWVRAGLVASFGSR
jgi:hypothetical protein